MIHAVAVAATGLALGLAVAGCATTTSTNPTSTTVPASTTAPAVSTGGDVERCQTAGGIWRNGMCTTMGGGGY
ncbi:MAG: hypothetical protein AUG14_12065 [Candidatus Rokubacteria bacterium 13_1_20CM_2_68_19]|nr:MAG: hypothetical protein AUH18_00870 [Candidatus Rokubacteria bacterium 13_2_20CM_69_10]OLB43053.1 MAG: hypothetical protein AUI04_03300 [Candidatus Rokubacteria bacterium 13_2_20CM_2_64_8]OLC64947.1 MAG: hypothetical protein AUH76_03430 [Candidatus Rokubacteria bacterium 13_1_40CM_4_67_11]OLD30015.1 MAG: hypothetical protein AUI49_09955 [Candidatus Rokubacteria bacterium 13_1_40CM_2_68_13]OLD97738.1 MAG: hypothetical protein AUG80_10435 [Candidatus Rokubacteria bacterium 13_1_20CM_4_68_9]